MTPPFAANRWLEDHVDGPVALFVDERTIEEFADVVVTDSADPGPVGAVVIGDYSHRWNFAELNRAFRLLMTEPAPLLIALGMTRYWHAADGLRLDTAPFVVALQHASDIEPTVIGKPAKPFFETALAELGVSAESTWMIGDDIRGDIGGAQMAGLRGVLVQTGKYRQGDLEARNPARRRSTVRSPTCPWWQRSSVTCTLNLSCEEFCQNKDRFALPIPSAEQGSSGEGEDHLTQADFRMGIHLYI